jgi:hypothetical protein
MKFTFIGCLDAFLHLKRDLSSFNHFLNIREKHVLLAYIPPLRCPCTVACVTAVAGVLAADDILMLGGILGDVVPNFAVSLLTLLTLLLQMFLLLLVFLSTLEASVCM